MMQPNEKTNFNRINGRHYLGKPCHGCGGTLRHTSDGECVTCYSKDESRVQDHIKRHSATVNPALTQARMDYEHRRELRQIERENSLEFMDLED